MADRKRIPLDVLHGNPERVQPQISPDGTKLAYMAPLDGVLNVFVGTVGKDDVAAVTKETDRGVMGYAWAHDGRHLLYIIDQGGDENWRLFTVDVDSGDITDRTPFEGVRTELIALRKRFPHELLIGLNKDNEQLHDVYHLDLRTGALEKRVENPGFVGWIVDDDLQVRGAAAPQPDGSMVILVRDSEADEWRPLITFGPEDSLASDVVGFTKDGAGVYLQSSVGANAARLVKMDIASGETEVIYADPRYDVTGVLIHPDTREPQMVTVLKDRAEHVVLDPSIAADMEAIERIGNGEPHVVGRDHGDQTWLVAVDNDAGPVRYYSFDRGTKEATFLFDHRPELNDYELATMEPFAFTARDGLEVHGYVSFPPGAERANLPTVLNVHGGPWVRDSWGFNPEAQHFANRGYLHVQVNYRGSTGYGKDFVNAGDREWGGKMHDDLVDAVEHVVAQGWADRERVAIYGGSYGGYAALVGATFTPDVFRCAIAIVGPANLKTFIETIPPYWAPMIALFKTRVGDPDTDEDFLWSRSPLSKVDQIKIPMLIAHGANDPRVKLSETEQLVAAMDEKGIPHELMVFDDEGHGFAKPENRLKFYERAEAFLEEHLA